MVSEKSPVDTGDWEYDNTEWRIVPSKDSLEYPKSLKVQGTK